MPRPTGTTEAGDRRRAEILRKAEELLVAGTFRDMKMDAIADAVDVAKSTLYHYFPKKDIILFELMTETLEQLIGLQRARIDKGLSCSELIYECMCDVMELTGDSPGRARALYEQKSSLEPQQIERIDRLEREYFEMIADVIRRGIVAGEFADIDPMIATRAVIAMVAHARHWYIGDGAYTPREIAYMFWRLFMNGAAAQSS